MRVVAFTSKGHARCECDVAPIWWQQQSKTEKSQNYRESKEIHLEKDFLLINGIPKIKNEIF